MRLNSSCVFLKFNFKLLWQWVNFSHNHLCLLEIMDKSYLIIIIIVIIFSSPKFGIRILIFMQNYFIVNDTATKLVVLCRLLFLSIFFSLMLTIFFNTKSVWKFSHAQIFNTKSMEYNVEELWLEFFLLLDRSELFLSQKIILNFLTKKYIKNFQLNNSSAKNNKNKQCIKSWER